MPPPYAAYLRIYEPLAAFSKAEQQYWRQYLASELAPQRSVGARLEHEHALRRMLTGQLPDPGEHAFVTARGEVPMICPWRTALRAWEAAGEFHAGMAGILSDAFLPPSGVPRGPSGLAARQVARPVGRSHIETATWAVPVRWFVLFGSEDKLLRIDGDERELVYITEMAKARRRAARALASLHKGLGETFATEAVEDMARWLEEFHPRSLVELDYGGLIWLFPPGQLVLDESASDVAIALRALAIGDDMSATHAYERVSERWRSLQLLEGCN